MCCALCSVHPYAFKKSKKSEEETEVGELEGQEETEYTKSGNGHFLAYIPL
jgi:hypothetical protein